MIDDPIRLMACATGEQFTAYRRGPVCNINAHVWVWWGQSDMRCAVCHPPASGKSLAPECQPF